MNHQVVRCKCGSNFKSLPIIMGHTVHLFHSGPWVMGHGSVTHDPSEISVYSPVKYESLITIVMIIFNDEYGNTKHI